MLWQQVSDWEERSDDLRLEALLQSMASVLRTKGVPAITLGYAPVFTSSRGSCDEPFAVRMAIDGANLCDLLTTYYLLLTTYY